MAQVIADRRDIEFVLYEQMAAEELFKAEKFKDLDKKTVDLIINEARNFAIKEILPTNSIGDKEGVKFKNGEVHVPECYHKPLKMLLEAELTSLNEDPKWGGQGLPNVVSKAAIEYLFANYCMVNYVMMGHGTGKMVELFGTDQQKELFLRKLYKGEWGGTMLLTESVAGSDVGALETTAVKNEDGTYSLSGNKIFITNGEHNVSENIIHPVLARIEGAPPGTKGISIFLVPKFWVNEDGSLGDRNDIWCTGVEEKMGIHSSATCSMAMGSKGDCRGVLLGTENEGMKIMFHMMNDARLTVGFQGFSYASNAYLAALTYARERVQGRDIAAGKDKSAKPVAIINHPDVRRMLLGMKAQVDGMRSFTYYVSRCFDIAQVSDNEEERQTAAAFTDMLTPVVKAYCSQRGYEVCSTAMLVFGGYGYTKEYPVEQLTRDCRIASIYEGTDGIQAMDLLGRKITMNDGKTFVALINKMVETLNQAKEIPRLEDLAQEMEYGISKFSNVMMEIDKASTSANFKTAYSFATPFLEIMGDIIIGWMLLWRAAIAAPKIETAKKKDIEFYEGQIKTAEFYIKTILPGTLGKMNAVSAGNGSAVEISDAGFGGL
ncbi:acyl-CoA dehydrogenase [bacterium]|nr:acyl-CoA dehydrogenase [bacterium]